MTWEAAAPLTSLLGRPDLISRLCDLGQMFYQLCPSFLSSGTEDVREPSWGVRDTVVSPEGEALSVLLLLAGSSLVPKETRTMEDDSSKPLTLLVATSTAERTLPEALVPITQEVLEGRWHLVKNSLHSSTKIPPGPARKNAWIPAPM